MGLEIIILTEVSQTTERKVAYDIAYMWNVRKKKYQQTFTKQK